MSEGELIEQQIAEQQHAQLAQQGAGSSTVISAGHMTSAGEVAGSPQRNYYMWKDSLQQPQQSGKISNAKHQILFKIISFCQTPNFDRMYLLQ